MFFFKTTKASKIILNGKTEIILFYAYKINFNSHFNYFYSTVILLEVQRGKREGAFDSLNPVASAWFFIISCVILFSGDATFSFPSTFNGLDERETWT